MKYLGVISDPKDLTNKKYVDDKVGEVSASLTTLSGRVDTAEDNIQMAESDIGDLQTETGTLKSDMTAVKTAVKTLQDTYVPNTTKVNGKALDADVTLTATDVGALPSTTTYVASVDGVSGAVTTNAVKYTTQSLSTAQKTQARANIGAGTSSFSGAYDDLTGKPAIPSKTSELTNDSDYITADEAPVQSINAKTGAVVLTASDIGAGNTNTYKINSVSVATSAWVANTNSQASTEEKQDYPFMTTVAITTPAVTSDDIARVMFGYAEQASGNYSLNCYTTTNGVIIQATEKPSAAITLEYILIERIL